MENTEKAEGMLSPYRVLDLTDEKALLCGKILGDLGADVIKIERPGGDLARNIGPFYHDEVDPEKSLFWWAYNTSKRGITLDIETSEGQETFKKLVKTADFVIESFSPGYMDRLGLGYSALEKINPGIIMVSITPFGQTGPYKDYKAPGIVVWAMGGQMYQYGDADRPPIRISHHSQSYLHAGGEAAVGAMMALHYREIMGEGQHVDVSIQDCVARILTEKRHIAAWDMLKVVQWRGEQQQNIRLRRIWPCQDGLVVWIYFFGPQGKAWNLPLVGWMDEEGMADDFIKEFEWDSFDQASMFQATGDLEEAIARMQGILDRLAVPTLKFFMSHTKAELLEGAVKHRAMLYPITTTKDILESVQLAARNFWVKLEHPELGTTITYPGAFAHASEAPPRVWRRAPLIGEHNQEILDNELTYRGKASSAKPEEKNRAKSPRRRALEGIRALDFGWAWTGPLTAKTLSDYGAEVIKIEGRSRPDIHRTSAPPFKDNIPGIDRSGTFNQDNTGKLSIALNLAHPRGVEIVKKLVARADIVIENYAGGVLTRMGLGYEELKKVKPDIIMLSSCMQGQTGPYSNHPGYGLHLTSLAGFSHIAGWPDREPAWLSAYTDFPAPRFNVTTILAALDYRRRTGQGQYIDMAQFENAIHFLAPLVLDYTVNGRVAERRGNRYPYAAPHNAYRCLGNDRWCAIAVFTDKEWQSFCQVIGNPAWASDAKFSTLTARKDSEDELDKLVEEWTINQAAEKVMSMMQAAGVGAGLLETAEDLLDKDPQIKHRHLYRELDHPEIGQHRAPGPAFTLSKSPYEVHRTPLLGEHNEYILKEFLNMPDEEIAELVIEGVLE